MVFDVHQRNVTLLVLVFKNRSSRGWAFVSSVGVLFVLLIAPRLLVLMWYAPYDSLYIICVGEGRCTHWEGVFLTSTGQRGNQYCSLVEPVLVTNSDQYCFAS